MAHTPQQSYGGGAARRSRTQWVRAADRVFAPGDLYLGEHDEVIERLSTARGVIGFMVLLIAAIRFQGARGIAATFSDWARSLIFLSLAGFVSVIVVGAVLVAVTYPGRRRAAAWQLRWPFLTFAGLAFLLLVIFGPPVLITDLYHRHKPGETWLGTALVLVYLPVFFIGASYLCRALFLMATRLCRAADGHPLLPPLIAPLVTGLWAAQSLVFDSRDTGGMPTALHIALIASGPLSIGLLSCIEITRLRRNALFPFRGIPPRGSLRGGTRPGRHHGGRAWPGPDGLPSG